MTPTPEARAAEHAKYKRAYAAQPNYRMKKQRLQDSVNDLAAIKPRGSYLDVACGRGDMLVAARELGFKPVKGTEIVPELIGGDIFRAEAHALPFEDGAFDVVSLFDVIEHLLPGDDEAACRELARVAKRAVLLTANNKPSFNKAGDDLHINKRPYEEWDRLFREWFPGTVTWLKGARVSEAWRIDL